jgi:hypothetical protein
MALDSFACWQGKARQGKACSHPPATLNAFGTEGHHQRLRCGRYIIVSFVNATLVLSIGETVEEASA